MTAAALIAGAMAEGWPLALSIHNFSLAHLAKLYGFDPRAALAWAAAALIAAAYCLYTVRRLALVRARLLDLNALKLVAIPFALITGSFEEIFFRKGLMDLTSHHGASWPLQILFSAGAFGLAHGVWGLFSRSLGVAWRACAATGVLGAGLAAVYLLAERNVAPCMAAHIAINLVIEPWLLLAAFSARRPRRPEPQA